MESILDIKEKYAVDESIESLETYAYQPISGTKYNIPGQIQIHIENTSALFLPSASWLQIEGKLVKEDGVTVYATAKKITLTNNGPLYLFDKMKYELNGQEIESIYHPGHATTMLGLTKYSPNFNAGAGLNQCWCIDTAATAVENDNEGFKRRVDYILEKPTPRGSFRLAIPLSLPFGFCDDYNKVVCGFAHTLTLVRSASSKNALFRDATAADGTIIIDKISWMMPKVKPRLENDYQLVKLIASRETLSVGFRMRQCTSITLPQTQRYTWQLGVRSVSEKPRYIMVALQTDKFNDEAKNTATFDHCSLTNIYVLLNNERYPAIDFNANFTMHKYENLYKSFCDFIQKFYGIDPLVAGTAVDPSLYKELYPIFICDVSKQSERLRVGVVDITIEMFFGANVPENTSAFAVMISDRKLKFQSDGQKMNVIY